MTQLAYQILREIRDLIDATLPDDSDPTQNLVIDYPREREALISDSYCFRIGVGPALKDVEVSIGGGEWHRCRPSEGYWWFDWHSYLPGSKYVIARATTPSGDKIVTLPRRFSVELP